MSAGSVAGEYPRGSTRAPLPEPACAPAVRMSEPPPVPEGPEPPEPVGAGAVVLIVVAGVLAQPTNRTATSITYVTSPCLIVLPFLVLDGTTCLGLTAGSDGATRPPARGLP